MIDISTAILIAGIIIGAVLISIFWLKSDMAEIKVDLKAIDVRQRRMQQDVSYIRGPLALAIPGFGQATKAPCSEASTEE